MVNLRYIGEHQPKGMVINAEEKEVKGLLDTGNYEKIEYEKIIKKQDIIVLKKKEVVKDDSISSRVS